MGKYKEYNEVNNERTQSNFEYYLEDIKCESCLHTKKKSKNHRFGCSEDSCRFKEIRIDAITNGRLKRQKGHFNNHFVTRQSEQVPL